MYTQGVDPRLDFSHLPALRQLYERCTKMHIHERQPYVGELVFTAFSGSHQDAINKGTQYMQEHNRRVLGDPLSAYRSRRCGAAVRADHSDQFPVRKGRRGLRYAADLRIYPAQGYASGIWGAGQGGVRPHRPELSAQELFDVFRRSYLKLPNL